MNTYKRVPAILCFLLVILCAGNLVACSSSSKPDADTASGPSAGLLSSQAQFVKAYLDALCRGDYESYAAVCGVSVEDVREDFPAYLESIIDEQLTYVPSDAMITILVQEMGELFSKCKYTVQPSSEEEDGSFSVPVTCERFLVFKNALAKANADYDKWEKDQPEDLDEDVATDQFFKYIIDYCDEAMKNPEYADPITITVTMSPSEGDDGIYEFDEDDIDQLLYGLLDFSAWDDDVADEDEDAGTSSGGDADASESGGTGTNENENTDASEDGGTGTNEK